MTSHSKHRLMEDARALFDKFPSGPGISTELFLTQTDSRSLTWADGKLDMENRSTQRGLTVRLLKEARAATSSTQDFSEISAHDAWMSAATALEFSQPDPAITFPAMTPAPKTLLELDPEIFHRSGDEMKKNLQDFEKMVKAKDRRLSKVIRIGFSEASQEWALVNSPGVFIAEKSTESSFGLEVLAEENGRSEVSGRYQAMRFGRDLNPENLINAVCDEVLEALGSGPVPSGNVPVVFDPWVGCQFLETIAHGLCADQVQKGKSFFGRPQGQAVASGVVTIIDDGLIPKGLASSLYDDEGTPRRRTVPVKEGRFQALLYDATTARRDRAVSTGNGGRGSFSRPPAVRPSNFYLNPGSLSREAVIEGTPKGFLVQEVMGMHTADPVSGDFSVGAQGRWIENGKLAQGVRGVTLAGNLKTLLHAIETVASDLTWYGSTGTPTFKVSQLTIGGT